MYKNESQKVHWPSDTSGQRLGNAVQSFLTDFVLASKVDYFLIPLGSITSVLGSCSNCCFARITVIGQISVHASGSALLSIKHQ